MDGISLNLGLWPKWPSFYFILVFSSFMFNIICLDFNPPSCSVSTCPLPLSLILMESMLYLRGLRGFILKLSGLFLSSFYFALNPNQYSFQLTHCMFQLWKFPLCLFCVFRFSLSVSLCSPLSYWAVRRAVLISPFVSFIASIIWVWVSGLIFLLGHGSCWMLSTVGFIINV